VIDAGPFDIGMRIAAAAVAQRVHYLNLTEDVASTRRVRELARGAHSALIPQCGLAPGFISIVAHDLAARFEELRDVRMRVGALPKYPSNGLKYNLTWSTDGLINEYLNPCEAIVDGVRREMPALEELEHFSLDGDDYEAFNTSGGLGSLADTYGSKAQTMDYKTIRYPGHNAIMKVLMHDLRFREHAEELPLSQGIMHLGACVVPVGIEGGTQPNVVAEAARHRARLLPPALQLLHGCGGGLEVELGGVAAPV